MHFFMNMSGKTTTEALASILLCNVVLAGCPPRHPPHTPQPLNTGSINGSFNSSNAFDPQCVASGNSEGYRICDFFPQPALSPRIGWITGRSMIGNLKKAIAGCALFSARYVLC